MQKENCLCKKKNCPRHGNCEACKAYHSDSQRKRSVACERVHGKSAYKSLLLISIYLTFIQCLFLGLKYIAFRYTTETLYSRSMVTMFSMIVLFVFIILYCRRKRYSLSVFPKRFGILYVVATLFFSLFYLITLFAVKTFSVENALMLFYGSIVTPIFEELLFRGAIWSTLSKKFSKEWETYLAVTILFSLWHIGYAVGIYLWNGGNLLNCIAMKVMVGALFGLLTGAIRWKTKNCYCGVLIHGLLNAVG